jgi:ABC-2 type transport system permease protein
VFHRLASLIGKELIQIVRDRILVLFALAVPVVLLYLMGRATSQDIQRIPVAVVDHDHSPLSREIITALNNTRELSVERFPASLAEARKLMDGGDALAIIVIPPGFEKGTQMPTEVPQLQVVLDGASWIVASRALGAAQGAVTSLAVSATVVGEESSASIHLYPETLFNRTLDFRPHSVTAQMAFIVFEVTTLFAVMGIVRERELGTLEMLSITPLHRLELIAGKAITPLLIGVIDFLVMIVVTQVAFDVPFRGSFWLLFGLTLIYLVSETGYALMISTLTRTQQQAVTTVFVWGMLCITLSGYMVPVERLPQALQYLSLLIPLRHYLAVVRGVMLKGVGIAVLWPEALVLALLAVAVVFVATRTVSQVLD